jgi:hypothetical protein
MNSRFRLVSIPLGDGLHTYILLNSRGEEVANMPASDLVGEDVIGIARAFREEHPELFADGILVDSSSESERKNAGQFGDDGLEPVPGN